MLTSEVGSNEHFPEGHSLPNVGHAHLPVDPLGSDPFCACTFVSHIDKTPIEIQGPLYFHGVDEALKLVHL